MNKPRIAIIGCGGMARAHATAIMAFGGLDLVAAADPFEGPRAQMKQLAPSIRIYGDGLEMLAGEKPELVVVATPLNMHAKMTLAALRAGAHVLCEKPFTMTLAEADEVIDVARKAGRMLLVDHQFRINPRAQAALKQAQAGTIGNVRTMLGAAKGRFGGWELVESGTHLFDLAFLFGGGPKWVSGHLINGDRLAASSEIVESASVARISCGPVLGERAYITVGLESGAIIHCDLIDAPSTNFLQVRGTGGLLHVPIGAAKSGTFLYPRPYVNPNDGNAAWREIPVEWGRWGEQHDLYTYDLWMQWLQNPSARPMAVDDRHPMDAQWGRLALEVIHGAFESHLQDGRRVAIPLANRQHPLEGRKA